MKENTKDKENKSIESFDLATVDYKDTKVLKEFLNAHGRIVARKKSNVSAKQQRLVANAIKRARFMGLLPYIAR